MEPDWMQVAYIIVAILGGAGGWQGVRFVRGRIQSGKPISDFDGSETTDIRNMPVSRSECANTRQEILSRLDRQSEQLKNWQKENKEQFDDTKDSIHELDKKLDVAMAQKSVNNVKELNTEIRAHEDRYHKVGT